jgi:hypothetical protein
LCTDLAPGIRLTNSLIGFADEDFEHFVRAEAAAQLSEIQVRMVDHFVGRHKFDAYAAAHIAAAMLAADRGRDIFDLIHSEREPTAIGDPVLRREAQLQRLRIAMKVCRKTGNNVDAMMTLLIGAEALKTDVAIRNMLVQNPDLTAAFARGTASRVVLRDSKLIENHGPLLCHLVAEDARQGDEISVREGHRQIRAWLSRRSHELEEVKRHHRHIASDTWSIEDRDIAAETEAVLRVAGPGAAIKYLRRWSPKSVVLHVAIQLSTTLIKSAKALWVERTLAEGQVSTLWKLFLITPLALAGNTIELTKLEASLRALLRRALMPVDELKGLWNDKEVTLDYFDTIITACEIVAARGNSSPILPILEHFAPRELRRRDKLHTSNIAFLDVSLRAHALLERLAGRRPTVDSYLVDPPEPPGDLTAEKIKQLNKTHEGKKDELNTFIGPLMDVYDVRAQALVGSITSADVDEALESAVAHYRNEEFRLRGDHNSHEMRKRAALSIARLLAQPSSNRVMLMRHAMSLVGARNDVFGAGEVEVLSALALDDSLHSAIVKAATARAKSVRNAKAAAEEKLAALVALARLLIPISRPDAETLFNEAIEVAGEVDAEAVHELALFAPLSDRALAHMTADERRVTAGDLAIVSADAGIRLAGHDYFPWEKISYTLAALDLSVGLAATARWADLDIVDHEKILPSALEAALRYQSLAPGQIVALTPLLDRFSEELTETIVKKAAIYTGTSAVQAISEELASEELLRFGAGKRPKVSQMLESLIEKGQSGFWLTQLNLATKYQEIKRRSSASSGSEPNWLHRHNEIQKESDPFASIDWAVQRFVTPQNMREVCHAIFIAAQATDSFVSAAGILERMRQVVRLDDRVGHLNALSLCQSDEIEADDIARAIEKCVDEWIDESPSVGGWCREHLLHVIKSLLPGFSRWLSTGQSALPRFLERSGTSDDQICAVLIEGMERHVDTLNAPTVYALVGVIAQYCTPDEAKSVIARYASRLLQRIPLAQRDVWNLADLPRTATAGVARFMYAFLGDVDVRLRWRAAHAVRRLARLGEAETIKELMGLYNRTVEPSYRDPGAPFYWLAARLWLMVALDRIANETPLLLLSHGQTLLAIAVDDQFPHLLVRGFAKSAVQKLILHGGLSLDRSQQRTLTHANTSTLRTRKGRKHRRFDESFEALQRRRFHFDSMDTLPYWYSNSLEAFADVEAKDFLDVAERWIVDEWGVQGDIWRWDSQPRIQRFSGSYSLWDHRHGSMPTLERFNTYVEWHAMWCATGELLKTRALASVEKNYDYHSFHSWTRRAGLSAPPIWLADVRGPKPLEDRLWFPPHLDVDVWVENVSDNDLLCEVCGDPGSVVVGMYHDTKSESFSLTARIETALVSPYTAGALMRALQTIEDSHDYGIPPAQDDLEIDAPPYRLLGWLDRVAHESGIDRKDALSYDVRIAECRPSSKTAKKLNVAMVIDCPAIRWTEKRTQVTAFSYEAWGDTRGDEHHDSLRFDKSVRSTGWRLRIDRNVLKNFLHKIDLDLIVEVQTTRRNRGYEYSFHDEKSTKGGTFDKIVLLRRDGSIETAEGCVGTWTTSSS